MKRHKTLTVTALVAILAVAVVAPAAWVTVKTCERNVFGQKVCKFRTVWQPEVVSRTQAAPAFRVVTPYAEVAVPRSRNWVFAPRYRFGRIVR